MLYFKKEKESNPTFDYPKRWYKFKFFKYLEYFEINFIKI
tara:strand:- start:786 stop:905 length:120 start_codon:yes stop_codon:yes gene_type:complete